MILNYLKLENYRRFRELRLDLPTGVVGIVGDNGAGKTTLVEAIAWTLYGNIAARSGKDEIRSYGFLQGSTCSAELSFEFGGDTYLVRRELKEVSTKQRSTSGGGEHTRAFAYLNGDLVAKGVRGVRDYVQNLLGMDYPAFQISFYARQRELNALSDLRAGERKTQMVKMLGIDNLDKAMGLLRTDRRGLSEKLEYARRQLPDLEAIRSQKEEKESEFKQTVQIIGVTKTEAHQKKERLQELQRHYNELSSRKEKARSLEKDVEMMTYQERNLKQELANLAKEVERIEALKTKLESIESVPEEFKKVQDEVKSIEKARIQLEYREKSEREVEGLSKALETDYESLSKLKGVSPRMDQLKSRQEELKAQLEKNEKSLEELRERLTELRSLKKSRQDELKGMQEQLNKIEELGPDSKCDRCLRPLGDDFEEIKSHISEELKSLEDEIGKAIAEEGQVTEEGRAFKNEKSSLQSEYQKCQRELETFSRQLGQIEGLQKGISEKERQVQSLKRFLEELGEVTYDLREHQSLKAKLKELESKREEYIRIHQEVSKHQELSQRRQELVSQSEEVAGKRKLNQQQLEELNFKDSVFQEISNEREGAVKESHQLELKLKDQESRQQILQRELEALNEKLVEAEKLKRETEDFRRELSSLQRLEKVFGDLRIELISRIRPSL
ncbi:MAG: AAA family ATPase, partial [Candidatus Zixiibacteriota bacterium]